VSDKPAPAPLTFYLSEASDKSPPLASGPTRHLSGSSKYQVLQAVLPEGYLAIGPAFFEVPVALPEGSAPHTRGSDHLVGHTYELALLVARPGSTRAQAEREYQAGIYVVAGALQLPADQGHYPSIEAAASELLPLDRTIENGSVPEGGSIVHVVAPLYLQIAPISAEMPSDPNGSRLHG